MTAALRYEEPDTPRATTLALGRASGSDALASAHAALNAARSSALHEAVDVLLDVLHARVTVYDRERLTDALARIVDMR